VFSRLHSICSLQKTIIYTLHLQRNFEAHSVNNPEDMRKAGIDYAIRQILDLKQYGADGIHIYSMNKPKTTAEIMEAVK